MRVLVVALLLLVALLVVSQAVLPPLVSSRVEDRLTRGGGTAQVSIRSFPALRLLLGDGSEIEVRGEGLNLDVAADEEDVFDRLEGFGEVSVRITDFTVGPLRIGNLRLERAGEEPYRLRASASSSIGDLVRLGTLRLGLAGSVIGGILGGAASAALDPGRRVPLRLDMQLAKGEDGISVVGGGSTVAGYPTGPLGEAIAEAVLANL